MALAACEDLSLTADKDQISPAGANLKLKLTQTPSNISSSTSSPFSAASFPRIRARAQGEMALAIIKYTPFPRSRNIGEFTMADDPATWSDRYGEVTYILADIARSPNSASNLLLAILYSSVLWKRDRHFWGVIRHWACGFLFSMVGSPAKYLCWVQGIDRRSAYFKNVELTDGAGFFLINPNEKVEWVPYDQGKAWSSQRLRQKTVSYGFLQSIWGLMLLLVALVMPYHIASVESGMLGSAFCGKALSSLVRPCYPLRFSDHSFGATPEREGVGGA
ncbi:uncharacterized protein LY89DRAFT_742372 [Mollisia scopiformis]|uniref:Uncharacterized protein n=1 Tax=Mollisia scopiformis TaxID=149040 RepID=A0A132B6P2_MOLSC|nr:uncharacterized protein LY89DRAFT_742372 [Mollisia scopiformis]KUJ08078.1 hypothetical protein LY89DRAFT_742372 [Mollisia scopiformis]